METLLEYKCPSCGGALRFDATQQQLKCPYCDTELDVAALRELDEALQQDGGEMNWEQEPGQQWTQEESQGFSTYVCPSCGGEILCEESTAATHCPYCDNPVVVAKQFAGTLKPDLVVPFQLTKEQAMEAFRQHLQKKPLLPKLFKSQNQIEKLQGLYVPFWLFDAGVNATIRYRATRTRHWSDSNYNYTRTSYYSLLRSGQIAFQHVPVDGSVKMDNALMESIEPYDMTKAVDFETAYLAGFLADKFDVSAQDCKSRANDRIRASTESYFASTAVGYSTVLPEHSNISLAAGKVRYALLPVWLLTTRYGDQVYTFAMNGQTGKMVGNLPICWRTFFAYLLGIGLGSGALISLIACLL